MTSQLKPLDMQKLRQSVSWQLGATETFERVCEHLRIELIQEHGKPSTPNAVKMVEDFEKLKNALLKQRKMEESLIKDKIVLAKILTAKIALLKIQELVNKTLDKPTSATLESLGDNLPKLVAVWKEDHLKALTSTQELLDKN